MTRTEEYRGWQLATYRDGNRLGVRYQRGNEEPAYATASAEWQTVRQAFDAIRGTIDGIEERYAQALLADMEATS